jgi:hypothetical protein
MGYSVRLVKIVLHNLVVLLIAFVAGAAWAQGLSSSHYSATSDERSGLDLSPSNPLGMPASFMDTGISPDSIYLTDRMLSDVLRPIPNLQMGYRYYFGKSVGAGRLTFNYLPRIKLGPRSVVFGEANAEFTDFWKSFQSLFGDSATNRGSGEQIDLAVGGGYRRIMNDSFLLAVNGFYDATKLGGRWYSSGGAGVECVALLPGDDAIDLTFNWYGNSFNPNPVAQSLSNGPGNYDFHLGYSHELWNGGPDLRIYGSGYEFSAGNRSSQTRVRGIRGGAELKTRDGMFVVRYEADNDSVNGTYHMVGGYVNVGFDIARLGRGHNPIDIPEPIFASPRNLGKWLVTPASTRRRRLSLGAGNRYCVDGPSPWAVGNLDPRYLSPALPEDLSSYRSVRVIWSGVTSSSSQFFAFTDSKSRVYGTDNINFTGDGEVTVSLRYASFYSGLYPGSVVHSIGNIEFTGSICFEFLE